MKEIFNRENALLAMVVLATIAGATIAPSPIFASGVVDAGLLLVSIWGIRVFCR